MTFYGLKLKLWDQLIGDEQTLEPKVYPRANGEKISNSNGYLSYSGHKGKYFLKTMLMMHPFLIISSFIIQLIDKSTIGFYWMHTISSGRIFQVVVVF